MIGVSQLYRKKLVKDDPNHPFVKGIATIKEDDKTISVDGYFIAQATNVKKDDPCKYLYYGTTDNENWDVYLSEVKPPDPPEQEYSRDSNDEQPEPLMVMISSTAGFTPMEITKFASSEAFIDGSSS